jgi:uncharacterized protein YcbK (DUF882 family)
VRLIFDSALPSGIRVESAPAGHLTALARRRFLIAAGALALVPLSAAYAAAVAERSLWFVHTHTAETLSIVYFQNGQYIPQSLERVNHLLRDFRTNEVHTIDPTLLDILFDLHTRAKHDEPFEVISGYRSPSTNAALRSRSSAVAEHSLHMQGRAIDIRLRGFPTEKLRDLAIALQRGGVGFYPTSDFVHVDTGRFRTW